MQKRTTSISILILCVLFIQGCGIFSPCHKSNSSGFLLNADTDIPKRIGIIRFETRHPTSNEEKDEFSKHLNKLGFDVVETDEYRGAMHCAWYCGAARVKKENIMDLSNFYGSDYYKEFRDMLKEKFDVEAIFVGTVLGMGDYGQTYICVDLIDIKTGRIIWTGASDTPLFVFKNTSIPTTRKLLRRLESDIESHNEAGKSKAK